MTDPVQGPTDRLPHAEIDPALGRGPSNGHESSEQASRRVLLVSRDVQQRSRLYDTLRAHGYSVKTVFSTERALASLRHELPEAIVVGSCDDAYGLPDRVRRFSADIPILLLGSENDELARDPKIRDDIQGFLPDPVTPDKLLESLQRVMEPSRPAKPVRYPGPILIVDDEPELLRTLKDFLEARGCPVLTAASGEEALSVIDRQVPTLVILDIKMGGMDGLVTLKKLKQFQPDIPVIMATAVEDQELMTEAFALGAYEYLIKPYNLAALQAILIHLKTLLML
jgi:CheY-like chemotaxis protein